MCGFFTARGQIAMRMLFAMPPDHVIGVEQHNLAAEHGAAGGQRSQ